MPENLGTIMRDAQSVAGSLSHGATERPRHYLEILALYDRCSSVFNAICVLLKNGHVHEPVLLTRPLFTESLMLAELAATPEPQRAGLVMGWALEGLGHMYGFAKEAESRGHDATRELNEIQQRRAAVHRVAADLGIQAKKWIPDEKKLADAHGRGDEYLDFRITSQFVHGSDLALQQRYTKTADGVVQVGGPAASLKPWARPTGLFGTRSLLEATRAMARILDVPEPEELEPVVERVATARAELPKLY